MCTTRRSRAAHRPAGKEMHGVGQRVDRTFGLDSLGQLVSDRCHCYHAEETQP